MVMIYQRSYYATRSVTRQRRIKPRPPYAMGFADLTFPIPGGTAIITPQHVGLVATGGTTVIGMVRADLTIMPITDIVVTDISMNAGTY